MQCKGRVCMIQTKLVNMNSIWCSWEPAAPERKLSIVLRPLPIPSARQQPDGYSGYSGYSGCLVLEKRHNFAGGPTLTLLSLSLSLSHSLLSWTQSNHLLTLD